MNSEIFRLHADICKTLSHARRLEILSVLRHGEMSAGEIVKRLKASKANVSQHLAILCRAGILLARRHGTNIFYVIADRKVTKACDLMREVLVAHQKRSDRILARSVT